MVETTAVATGAASGIKAGRRFLHTRWITETRQPMPCAITRVARGLVYYKQLDEAGQACGGASYTAIERFEAERVKEWI